MSDTQTPGTSYGRSRGRVRGRARPADNQQEQSAAGVLIPRFNTNIPPESRGAIRGRRHVTEVLTTRPTHLISKKGKSGNPIKIRSNYLEFFMPKEWTLYHYRVDFLPEEDNTHIRRQLVGETCRDILSAYTFDGTTLLTPHRINPEPFVKYIRHPNGKGNPIEITIRLVGGLSPSDGHAIQFYNIVIRRCMSHMKLQLVRRNYYDAESRIEIPQCNLELWPGILPSVRQHESKILLCCELIFKIMRKDNVLTILMNEVEKDRRNYKRNFTQTITGAIVLTDYNNRTYRIDDVDWDATPQSTFEKSDGTSISYTEYYKQRYLIRISQVNQPLLISRAKPKEIRAGMAEIIYLIPELCRMTGLTDAERNNTYMMRGLADYTRPTPEIRQQRLLQYSNRVNQCLETVDALKGWDMKLSTNLVELSARTLPEECIYQGATGNIKYYSGPEADWTRNLRSNSMITSGCVNVWVVVCIGSLKNDVYTFVQLLRQISSQMNFNLPQPKLQQIDDERPINYLKGLDHAICNYNPSFMLCIVSNNKADRYAAIKKKCCVDKAIPTQVVLKKTIMNKVMSVATKIAIQINCKMGGGPWTLEIPLQNLMVVGYDACHDAINKSMSYGATVASLHRQCSRYFTAVSSHTNGEELSNDFALNILKAVKKYQEFNGQPPERIIIYRDGVGEGQLNYVSQHEVVLIEKTLKEYYKEKQLKFAFIVVTKRINTRFFYGSENPPAGTVVDDVVTLPYKYDFYLVSQCVRQGTVTPTYYNVLYDNLGLDPDKIQRLTYKFTHMYYNWSGTVRVPAPCQYAHKLAFLVAQSLHRNPNPQLETVLYFL